MIIKNGEVFQEDGSFRLQDLYVENHRIVASEDEVTDKTIVDAAGLRVLPGLVDIHSHGAFGHDFSDAAIRIYQNHPAWRSYYISRYHLLFPSTYREAARWR